ncbi:hypothetical protein [Streptosporangium sp. NPDC049644]|uniref:hypothetical protein n=1 Tax=Streptosporangium sp. NPDC049644 TaxID=3155507 RepID=UPI00343BF95E
MGSESGSRRIRATGAAPEPGEVTASRSQIEQWLRDTLPMMVDDAGFAYTHAASTIGTLRDALPSNATKLSQSWRGEASAEVQKALLMLHSTAGELVSTMEKMAEVLRLYGGVYLPEAREKIENLRDPKGLPLPRSLQDAPPGSPLLSGTSLRSDTFDADGTIAARQVLRTLNTQITELYHRVPEEISYDLPTVTMPSGTHTYTPVVYREGDPYPNGRPPSGEGSQGAGTGSGGGASGGASRGGATSTSGSGAPAPGASGADGSGPSGSNPSGPGADGADPGGSDPGGSGNGDPGSAGSTGTNGQDPSTDAGAARNSPDDGTVPAVIDGTDGTPGGDPGSTEVASFVPQNPVAVPVIQQNPVGLIGPTTTVAPPVTSVPPVLGTLGTGPGTAVPPYAATTRGAMGGMPMMPFMGGGAGGESAQETERFSPLVEENDVWGSRPDVTSALIGESVTDSGKARHGDRA